jgi:outer membrane immunogenic protein
MLASPPISAAFDANVAAGPVVAPWADNWTGCYVGIEGGGNWGRSQHTAVTAGVPADVGLPITNNFYLSGGLFGGTVGCNYQSSDWVIGIENDFSWTNKQGSGSDIPPFNTNGVSHTSEKWLDTLRGRIGASWDLSPTLNRSLFYATGGVAFASTAVDVCATVAGVCVSDSQTRTGWVAGVGFEYAVWQNVSLKIEYLYAQFGTGRYINPPVTIAGVGTFETRDVSLIDNIVRVGINYTFN